MRRPGVHITRWSRPTAWSRQTFTAVSARQGRTGSGSTYSVFGAARGDACSAVFVLGDQEVAVAEGGRVPDRVREDYLEAVVRARCVPLPELRGCPRWLRLSPPLGMSRSASADTTSLPGLVRARRWNFSHAFARFGPISGKGMTRWCMSAGGPFADAPCPSWQWWASHSSGVFVARLGPPPQCGS